MKIAVAVLSPFILKLHLGAVPEHAPLQPANVDPAAGSAFSVAVLPYV